MNRLSTEEAASRLGVKKQTIYAYVSRGILARQKAVDGKASTFDADEVDRLRRQRLGGHPGRLEAPVTTAIADVRDGVVRFRGRSIVDLANETTSYEEVAALLWDVPFDETWTAPDALVEVLTNTTRQLPAHATLVDHVLACAVMAGAHDPFRNDRRPESAAASMRSLVAATTEALPMRKKRSLSPESSIAERLWPRLTTASSSNVRVLDQSLMLMADHGIASSTLAARIAASTRAGPHSAVIAGLGALNGPLHGAASRAVHEMLLLAEGIGVEGAISEVLLSNAKMPGIGHFIHRTSDPRFEIMMGSILESTMPPQKLQIVQAMIDQTADRFSVPHNIDFSLGSFTFAAGMEPDAGELIFALARVAGWVAHTLEEYDQSPLRFRPIGRYEPKRPRPAPDE